MAGARHPMAPAAGINHATNSVSYGGACLRPDGKELRETLIEISLAPLGKAETHWDPKLGSPARGGGQLTVRFQAASGESRRSGGLNLLVVAGEVRQAHRQGRLADPGQRAVSPIDRFRRGKVVWAGSPAGIRSANSSA
jgi:hypothetical protein